MRPVRWGVIGAGGIADKRTIPGMLCCPDAELVAIAEVDAPRRAELAHKYGVTAYADAEALLADERLECVYIASPVPFHRAHALASARAGKHMLLEKPIAVTVAEAEEIARACDAAGVLASVGFMMRFHEIHRHMRAMVQSGKLGEIVACRAQFGGWSEQTGQKWRHVRAQGGGGSLMDMGIHAIDLLRYILDGEVQSVAAINATLAHTFDVEDTSGVLLEFVGGQPGYVDSYFSMPTDLSRLEIYGTDGAMVAEGTLSQEEVGSLRAWVSLRIARERQKALLAEALDITLPVDGRYTCYTKQIAAMCRAVQGEAPVAIPLQDAMQNQRIIEAAYRSSARKEFVTIP